jgi:outer membrane protein assembly factor BamB
MNIHAGAAFSAPARFSESQGNSMKRKLASAAFFILASAVMAAPPEGKTVKWSGGEMDAGDWPQFRGPLRDGVSTETGLLDKWPDEGPPVAWKLTGLGRGLAATITHKGRFYIVGDHDQSAFLQCFDLKTREKIWSTKIGKAWGGGDGASPAVDGDAIFGQTNVGDNYCIGLDGKLRWVKNNYTDFKGFLMNPQYGFPQTPLVDGKNVVVNPGGVPNDCVVALDRDTGKTIWSVSGADIKAAMKSEKPRGSDRAAYACPVVSEAAGYRHYVLNVGRGLIGLDPKNGKVLWGYNLAGGEANIPTPIVRGDYVYCCSSYGAGTVLLKISKDGDGLKAEKVYHIDLNNLEGQSVLVGDHTYTGEGGYSGNPVCVEFLTGKIVWKGKQKGAGVAGLTSVEGKLIFRAESGEVSMLEASPKGHNLISWFKPDDGGKGNEARWSHPVVSHGLMFIRQHDTLLAYDLRKK